MKITEDMREAIHYNAKSLGRILDKLHGLKGKEAGSSFEELCRDDITSVQEIPELLDEVNS